MSFLITERILLNILENKLLTFYYVILLMLNVIYCCNTLQHYDKITFVYKNLAHFFCTRLILNYSKFLVNFDFKFIL